MSSRVVKEHTESISNSVPTSLFQQRRFFNLLEDIMRLCVIGAGAAGLCAVKRGVEFGCKVTAFEQIAQVGGTWAYTDDVETDKYGCDVHSSMYQGLKTNLPKEIMAYPDFAFPEQERSYIPQEEVLEYYRSYANYFNLHKHYKFEHHVLRIRPLLDETWEVIVKDLKADEHKTYIFDLVLIGNGHYTTPIMPKFEHQEVFKGKIIHSRDYRCAEIFKDKIVLVIGAGASGLDCVAQISKVAKTVAWSHHASRQIGFTFNDNVVKKPEVKELTRSGVIFVDGSHQDCDVIIYCTGYKYSFPFLSVDCDVECDNNYIRPLYKHCLSINRPTLGFIGLLTYYCPNPINDLQVRFCLPYMMGQKKLPTKSEMLKITAQEYVERKQQGFGLSAAHYLGVEFQRSYVDDLAKLSEIQPIKPVIIKIFDHVKSNNLLFTSANFRDETYKVIDDENFVVSSLKR